MSTNTSVDHPFLKAGTALGGAGFAQAIAAVAPPSAPAFVILGVPISTMADWAAFAAFIYSVALTAEFIWRKFLRPFAENRKWLKRKFRRVADQQFHDKYGV